MSEQSSSWVRAGDALGTGPVARVVGNSHKGLGGRDELRNGPAEGHQRLTHGGNQDQVGANFGERMHCMRIEQVTADGGHKVISVSADVHPQFRPALRLNILRHGPISR